jgi:hypothetical protein
MSSQTIQLITWAITVVAPLIVGLVTKSSTNSRVKSLLLAALSLAVGVGNQAVTAANAHAAFNLTGALYASTTALVTSVALHYGVFKPTGAAAAVASTLVKDVPALAPVVADIEAALPAAPAPADVATESADVASAVAADPAVASDHGA